MKPVHRLVGGIERGFVYVALTKPVQRRVDGDGVDGVALSLIHFALTKPVQRLVEDGRLVRAVEPASVAQIKACA
jgi:hypothetical protein